MGNRMTVSHPYIIDEYPSDDATDEEDDDDYFAYESAYEALDQRLDEEDYDDELDDDMDKKNIDSLSTNLKSDDNQVSVNSQVVNSLVKEVETLLTYLDKEDYEGAQKAARVLKEGGGEGEGNVVLKRNEDIDSVHEGEIEPLLQCEQQPLRECAVIKKDQIDSPPSNAVDKFQEEGVPLLNDSLEDNDWTSEERKLLQQLEHDLNAFEENESRVVSEAESSSEIQPRRRKRKSSLPRLKPGATFSNSNDGGDDSGGNRSRESSLTRSSRRSQGSAIPRFCYKASVASTTSTAPQLSPPVKAQSSQGDMQRQSSKVPHGAGVSPAGDMLHQNGSPRDREGKGTEAEAWEVNISDLTGRVRQNKKRSGIPSTWLQSPPKPLQQTRQQAPSSPSVRSRSSTSITSPHTQSDTAFDVSNFSQLKWEPNRRKVLDLKRWDSISRPQYKTSCGISSVVSCWNFLFSTMGHGHLNPISQEDAMRILGFESPFDNIKFGPFTGNLTLMRWFRKLCNHFEVQGRCYYMFKPCGRNRTVGVTPEMALEKLKCGLQDSATTFIYHCHNHYFCPIGFEETPTFAVEAYTGKLTAQSIEQSWVLVGDTSRKYQPIHCVRWEEICVDLNCKSPEYFNIRKPWKGVMTRQNCKKSGGNLHCIMCFQRSFTPTNQTNSNFLPSFHLHPPSRGSSIGDNQDESREDFETDSLCEENMEDEIESVSSDDDDDSFDADSLS